MLSDNFVPVPPPSVSSATLDAMAVSHRHAVIVHAGTVAAGDTVLAHERDGDRVLVVPAVAGRTIQRGVSKYERVVEVGGRRVVFPAGTPVSRGTVRWGGPSEPKDSVEDQTP